ncbi:hypothetical protein F2Q69_00001351 [Brassica cretica]|uniref:Uncharacterized protein n=1 Tax=Brassica cretica TaxID=69181 RepID=A0A8S9P928_BRACR|nr:hypothetical protein F2Q69_00001351 [Brassica cretica]
MDLEERTDSGMNMGSFEPGFDLSSEPGLEFPKRIKMMIKLQKRNMNKELEVVLLTNSKGHRLHFGNLLREDVVTVQSARKSTLTLFHSHRRFVSDMLQYLGEDIEISNLGFGLDFDLERVDPGREDSGEPLTRERVEEVATRLGYVLESTPAFNHTNARLIYATSDDAIRIPHFDR